MGSWNSHWQELLDLALPAIDHVASRVPPGTNWRWSFGDGTALALQIDHRVSYDIDLFVSGVRLKLFTPHQNPAAKLISDSFQWPGFYLKFQLPIGEIDFLSSDLLTSPGVVPFGYKGRQILLETPEEIVVKKLRYRSASLKLRDVFDLACTSVTQQGLAAVLAEEVPDILSAGG